MYFMVFFIVMIVFYDVYFYWIYCLFYYLVLFCYVYVMYYCFYSFILWMVYVFDFVEVVINGVFVFLFVCFVLVYFVVIFLFMIYMIVCNVLGYCGYEFMFKGMFCYLVFKWLILVIYYDFYYVSSWYNFGFYFFYWDKWMGMEYLEYEM